MIPASSTLFDINFKEFIQATDRSLSPAGSPGAIPLTIDYNPSATKKIYQDYGPFLSQCSVALNSAFLFQVSERKDTKYRSYPIEFLKN